MRQQVRGFLRFCRQMLGPWGQFISGMLVVIAAVVGVFGTPEQQQQSNNVAQLLLIAPWYTWALGAAASALAFALFRGYEIVETRTRGFQIFDNRGELARAHGTFDYELRNVERAWLMCPVATTLQASSQKVLDKIDRSIFADIHKPVDRGNDFAVYTRMVGAGSKIFRANLYQISQQLQRAGKEVKWHRHPPLGVLIADPKSDDGWARLELLMPYVGASQRINLKVYRRDRPEVFDRIVQMFEDSWSGSVDPDWANLPSLYPDQTSKPSSPAAPSSPPRPAISST